MFSENLTYISYWCIVKLESDNAMLKREEQIKLASELIRISYEEAEKYCRPIENSNALYFSVPVRGGDSIIVGEDGQVLYANSSIDYLKHVDEYNKGRRTPLEAFKDE